MKALTNKNIVLGVSGSIAAYKSPDIVRRLQDLGAEVRVVLTSGGAEFVSERSLQTVSKNKVQDNLWDPEAELSMGHIELAKWADAIVIAPASANTIAKLCHGKADDLLTTLILATTAAVLIAPAMNQQMYSSMAMRDNLGLLQDRGIVVTKPEFGIQACGDIGEGRLAEPDSIALQTANLFQNTLLSGKKVMITLGATIEPIDPVRYISNHSSGKMGMALASACVEAGAEVTLIMGAISVDVESRTKSISVGSADEMYQAVIENIIGQDIFIACAAVADYKPAIIAKNKIKKDRKTISIELIRNPDILAEICRLKNKPICIGFAAETDNLLDNAKNKLKNKGCDAIILNDVSNSQFGMNSDQNEVFFITENQCEKIDISSKIIIAHKLVKKIAKVLNSFK